VPREALSPPSQTGDTSGAASVDTCEAFLIYFGGASEPFRESRLGDRRVSLGTLFRTKGGPAEAQSAEKAMRLLGGHLKQMVRVSLPGIVEERYLVLLEKSSATPPRYPRKAGTPMKHPL